MTAARAAAEDVPALGVVGTAVLDTLYPWSPEGPAREPVVSFGGVFYALNALAALAPHPSAIVPVLHVGAEAAAFVRAELAALGVDGRHVRVTPARQNAVELRYTDRDHRVEVLHGGVPSLRLADVAPVLREVAALYVNFVAGNELELATLRGIRRGFTGPIYGDLHSLLLGRTRAGLRFHRPLPRWREWVACLDVVQCNPDEAATLWRWRNDGNADAHRSPRGNSAWIPRLLTSRETEQLARAVLALGPRLFIVTRGAAPVRAYAADGRSWSVTPRPRGRVRDPTGCGDVLGAAFCAFRYLHGLSERVAVARAVSAATRASTRVGTHGLAAYLRGGYVARHG